MSLALLFHYLRLNMFRMLIRPSSGDCDLFVELFHGLYCSGSMCWCYFVVWLWWCGIRMQTEALVWYPYAGFSLQHYLMLNMFRMLIHPSSGACDLFVELFHGLYCSGSMCAYGYHTTPTKPQRNTNTYRTRAIQPMK